MTSAHLRFHHPDGTSKDWIAEVLGDKLRVRFGKTGGRMQMRETPASQCMNGSPIAEFLKRRDEKLAKGYREASSPTPPSSSPPTKAKPQSSPSVRKAMEEMKSQGKAWF